MLKRNRKPQVLWKQTAVMSGEEMDIWEYASVDILELIRIMDLVHGELLSRWVEGV